MEFIYPWPNSKLNPNRNTFWRAKAKIKADARSDAFYLTKTYPIPNFEENDIHLRITFHPPTKRKYDVDNALAALKSTLDGIADAWGVNDRRFRPITIEMSDTVVRDGKVIIKIVPN